MPLIQMTEEATDLLKGHRERVEVFDAAGNLLGVFIPYTFKPPLTPEEIEARQADPRPGKPLAEILARLQAEMPSEE